MRRGSADPIRASGHKPAQQAGYKTAICLTVTPKSDLASREASIQSSHGRPEASPPHGTYDAHHHLEGFRFDADDTAKAFNTKDHAGSHPDPSGKKMHVASFDVDASNLAPGTGLHFDLFGGAPTDGNVTGPVTYNFANLERIRFAPFSHDVAMVSGANETVAVPEPGTLAVFAAGLVALIILRWRSDIARQSRLG